MFDTMPKTPPPDVEEMQDASSLDAPGLPDRTIKNLDVDAGDPNSAVSEAMETTLIHHNPKDGTNDKEVQEDLPVVEMGSMDGPVSETTRDGDTVDPKGAMLETMDTEPTTSSTVPIGSPLEMQSLKSSLPSVNTVQHKIITPKMAAAVSYARDRSMGDDVTDAGEAHIAMTPLIAAATIDGLTTNVNRVLLKHYGNRIRYSGDVLHTDYAVAWNIKFEDVLVPIGILLYRPFQYPEDGHLNRQLAHAVKLSHGCLRIAISNGRSLVMFTYSDLEDKSQKVHLLKINGSTSSAHLLIWLGRAIQVHNIPMLQPLPHKTLSESTIDALDLEPPARGFEYYNTINTSQLVPRTLKFGPLSTTYYSIPKIGRILCIEPAPLPDQDITTVEEVRDISQSLLVEPINYALDSNYHRDIKCSKNIIRNASFWFERGNKRSKNAIAILQYAAPGTIVVDDWGVLRPDLTFTNGEGIVRSAVPLMKEMEKLAEQYDCHCMGLFDYRNVVFVTWQEGCDEASLGSMVMLESEKVRDGTFRWMLLACQIQFKLEIE